MADTNDRSALINDLMEQQAIRQNTQSAQLLDKATVEQLQALVEKFNRSVQQFKGAMKDLASSMKQQGRISQEASMAVHIQMDDSQLQKKISQLASNKTNILMNIDGKSDDVQKIQKVLQSLIKKCKQGDKSAQQMIKSLDFSKMSSGQTATKTLKQLQNSARRAGTSLNELTTQQYNTNTIFGKFSQAAQQSSKAIRNNASQYDFLVDKLGGANTALGAASKSLLKIGASALGAIKGLNQLNTQVAGGIQEIIKFKNTVSKGLAKNGDLLPGGPQQLASMRKNLNLSRQDTVKFVASLQQLRGTGYAVNDLNDAMKGMKETFGSVDTSQLEKVVELMKSIPKEQLDALTGKSNSATAGQDAAAGLVNLRQSGNIDKFLQAGASGALGKDFAETMGSGASKNDKQYAQNKAKATRMRQGVEQSVHELTSSATKYLPYIAQISKGIDKISGLAPVGGTISGAITESFKSVKSLFNFGGGKKLGKFSKNSFTNIAKNILPKSVNNKFANIIQSGLGSVKLKKSPLSNVVSNIPGSVKLSKTVNELGKKLSTNNDVGDPILKHVINIENLLSQFVNQNRIQSPNQNNKNNQNNKDNQNNQQDELSNYLNRNRQNKGGKQNRGKAKVDQNVKQPVSRKGYGKISRRGVQRTNKRALIKAIGKKPGRNASKIAKAMYRMKMPIASVLKHGGKRAIIRGATKLGGKALGKSTSTVLGKLTPTLGKLAPALGKFASAVGIAASVVGVAASVATMVSEGMSNVSRVEKQKDQANQFFGTTASPMSFSQKSGAFLEGALGAPIVSDMINMFRDPQDVKKQRIVAAQAGVSSSPIGSNTVGGTVAGAGLGAGVGGLIGSIVGSIIPGVGTIVGGAVGTLAGAIVGGVVGGVTGAIKDGYNAIKRNFSDTYKYISQQYDIIDAFKKEQKRNALKQQNIMIHTAKVMKQNKIALQRISKGQYSVLQTTKVQTYLAKRDNALLVGMTNKQQISGSQEAVKNSLKGFAKDMSHLTTQRQKIASDKNMNGQAKLYELQKIFETELQIRKKLNDNLLKSMSLDSIPKVLQNQLTKAFNQAAYGVNNALYYGSSQANNTMNVQSIGLTFDDMFSKMEKMASNTSSMDKIRKENEQFRSRTLDEAFKGYKNNINGDALQGAANAYATKNKSYNIQRSGLKTAKGYAFSSLFGSAGIVDNFGSNSSDDKELFNLLAKGAGSNESSTTGMFTSQSDLKTMLEKNAANFAKTIKSGNVQKINEQLATQQAILNYLETRAETKQQKEAIKTQRQQLKVLQKQLLQETKYNGKLAAYYSRASQFTKGKDIQSTTIKKDKQFIEKAKKAGALKQQNGKTVVVDEQQFKAMYNSQRQDKTYQLVAQSALKGNNVLSNQLKENHKNLLDQKGKLKKNLTQKEKQELQSVVDSKRNDIYAEQNVKVSEKMFGRDVTSQSKYNNAILTLYRSKGAVGDEQTLTDIADTIKEANIDKKDRNDIQSQIERIKNIRKQKDKDGKIIIDGKEIDKKKAQEIETQKLRDMIGAKTGKLSQTSINTSALAQTSIIEQSKQSFETIRQSQKAAMESLNKTAQQLASKINNLIASIDNDVNVRRLSLKQEHANIRKQLAGLTGQNVGAATEKSFSATQATLAQKNIVIDDLMDRFVDKDGKLKDKAVFEKGKAKESAKKVSEQFKKDSRLKSIKADKNIDQMFEQVAVAVEANGSSEQVDKIIKGAVDNISKQEKAAIDTAKQTYGENTKAYKEVQQQIRSAATAAKKYAETQGNVSMIVERLQMEKAKNQIAEINAAKDYINTMKQANETMKAFRASIEEQAFKDQFQYLSMQFAGSQQLSKNIKGQTASINEQYDQKQRVNTQKIIEAEKALQKARQELAKTTGDDKESEKKRAELKKTIDNRETAIKAAKGQSYKIQAERKTKLGQSVKAGMSAISQKYSSRMENVSLRQEYAQGVSGTTQQWYKLQNEKLSLMKQEVQELQNVVNSSQFAALSEKDQQQIRNKLMQKSIALQKQRIATQRTVFEKQLGAILGGFEQQGAFKGFNQASVFGSGHGINQAGMATSPSKKGDSKADYTQRVLSANESTGTPTEWSDTKGNLDIHGKVGNMGTQNNSETRGGKDNKTTTTAQQTPQQTSVKTKGKKPQKSEQKMQKTQQEKQAQQQAKQQKESAMGMKDHQIFANQLLTQKQILKAIIEGIATTSTKSGQKGVKKEVAKPGQALKVQPTAVTKTAEQIKAEQQKLKQQEVKEMQKFAGSEAFGMLSEKEQKEFSNKLTEKQTLLAIDKQQKQAIEEAKKKYGEGSKEYKEAQQEIKNSASLERQYATNKNYSQKLKESQYETMPFEEADYEYMNHYDDYEYMERPQAQRIQMQRDNVQMQQERIQNEQRQTVSQQTYAQRDNVFTQHRSNQNAQRGMQTKNIKIYDPSADSGNGNTGAVITQAVFPFANLYRNNFSQQYLNNITDNGI